MNGPLKNLLVIDLTRVLVGPYCTMILSDLGARVIKIEAPEVGDDSRKFGPFIDDYSAYFMSLNRGKESIALNLKNSDDKKIFDKNLPIKLNSRVFSVGGSSNEWTNVSSYFEKFEVSINRRR